MLKWVRSIVLTGMLFLVTGCGANGSLTSSHLDNGRTEEPAVYLQMEKEQFSLQAEEISYTILNETGKDIYVTLIPNLERKTDSGWEKVETVGVGFCGTPDRVEAQREGAVPLLWYDGSLYDGQYRLSFEVVDFEDYTPVATIADIFYLSETEIEKSEPAW